ncbi:MAG: response regulator transcription factor [Oscillospiraceae bacterium]|jgi:DNA-binding response OmpR family regulator|nr:response regulator transcription factor [Oscillospiraceae bacterium]
MKHTILICDDDEDILSVLSIYLEGEGYNTQKARNGRQAVEAAEKGEVHLFLLDVMMPVMDGIRAAVKIREISNAPIVFLSAKAEETDRILGLNMGGDDYVTKPFNPAELFARVRAALRRYSALGGINGVPVPETGVYSTGGLVLDDNKKLVTADGAEVALTPVEFNILKLLISNPDRVFSSERIYETVWDEPAFDISKTVSVHVRHIREKTEINPKEPRYLKTVYGLGYKVVGVK